ncbi:hypothetical protein BH09MYX1_BH09MYX1_55990 [soil metagenome]
MSAVRFVAESVSAVLSAVAARHRLDFAPGVLTEALVELSRDYNERGTTASRPEILAARLLSSVVRAVPKNALAVRELCATGLLELTPERALRVLDLGAGLGASTIGLAAALGRAGGHGTIDALLVDVDAAALSIAKDLAVQWPMDGDVRLVAQTLRASVPLVSSDVFDRAPYDVILVGQVLSELDRDASDAVRAERHGAWLTKLLGALTENGTLVVIEPALLERTRHLHRVREHVRAHVFAPCLHHDTCPMLADERDWCHEDRPIDLPAFAEPLARAAGLRWQGLTFSYLLLRRDAATLRASLGGTGTYRLVESPRVTKGKRELTLCHGPILTRAMRLDRDAQKNEVVMRAARGDVLRVVLTPGADESRARIGRRESEDASLPVDALLPEP